MFLFYNSRGLWQSNLIQKLSKWSHPHGSCCRWVSRAVLKPLLSKHIKAVSWPCCGRVVCLYAIKPVRRKSRQCCFWQAHTDSEACTHTHTHTFIFKRFDFMLSFTIWKCLMDSSLVWCFVWTKNVHMLYCLCWTVLSFQPFCIFSKLYFTELVIFLSYYCYCSWLEWGLGFAHPHVQACVLEWQ